MEYKGSCLCKAVRFKVVGSFDDFYLCHCKYCRKDSGSAHAANLFASHASLTWLQGQSEVSTFHLKDTNHSRSFCRICGSALPNLQMDGELIVVPAGCLDTHLDKEPDGHIFISNKANWDVNLYKIKHFDKFPVATPSKE
ncbi:GFA family protein [Fusibacter sp. JL216-2]|uniref:GFA family protein n=1 Tax=Fusibacter sp. JL216-2 TaxID=3071453 RepID=UPI003D335DC5